MRDRDTKLLEDAYDSISDTDTNLIQPLNPTVYEKHGGWNIRSGELNRVYRIFWMGCY